MNGAVPQPFLFCNFQGENVLNSVTMDFVTQVKFTMPDKDYENKYFILWRWYKAYLFSLQPIINSIIHGIVPVNNIQDGIKMKKIMD